ncbi:MAG TPA: peroxiredoxin family protein [Chloroflexi bacterium]|nr:peroxiredoxin family protein [Chloroflexota bacterium]
MTEEKPKRVALIASQGTLDGAYPPLIIATTAVAMDMEVAIFFTFYGLNIIHKKKMHTLKVSPVGNPAMPMPIPSIVSIIPGMTPMATGMMKSWMSKAGTASIPDLVEACVEFGVRMIACQMTLDVLGIKREELIDECEVGGAATFLEYAAEADISLFM